MKSVLMMVLPNCPYCHQAEHMIEELINENPKYNKVVIRRVNEEIDTALANSLNYYYVPCFFVDGEKLLEGVPTKEKVRKVLDAALE